MKTTNYYLVLIVLGFVSWSCTSTSDLSDGSLKTSINKNAQNLTTAMNTIASSTGYKVLTSIEQSSSPSLVKSSIDAASVPVIDSIVLSDITGVYDY